MGVHSAAVALQRFSAARSTRSYLGSWRFWEQEEVARCDQEAEDHFRATHRRTSEGRFVVRLPFKVTPELGPSRPAALRTLNSMQQRFRKNPHHGVLKATSSTTKLRVVFNGPMATSNGKSFNDVLHTGPNLLPALAVLLLR